MRRCAWSLVGLLIAVRGGAAAAGSTMAGTRSLVGLLISVRGAATAGSTVTSAHPAGRRRLTYEYAPTENVMPYCRLQSSAVCWGNTHRFLEVTANGPFEGINVSLTSGGDPFASTSASPAEEIPLRSETSTATVRSDRVRRSIEI
jgi:hypothetical protein